MSTVRDRAAHPNRPDSALLQPYLNGANILPAVLAAPSSRGTPFAPAPDRSEPEQPRILLLNPSYPPVKCGVGNYTQGLARALVAAGAEVTVLTSSASRTDESGKPRVLALLREWDVRGFLRVWPRLRRLRADIVISSFPAIVPGRYSRLLYLAPVLCKALLGRPRTVFVVHEFIRAGEAERRWLGLALRATDSIIAVTDAERDAVVACYPSVASRIVVRENPSTVPAVKDDPAADARARAAYQLEGRPLVGFIGLLNSPAKGLEDLLEALVRTDAMLLSTGSLDSANEHHEQLSRLVERLGLHDRVRWLGHLDDEAAGRMLRVVDVVALPYRGGAESGYTSLLAALVNGAAVVTTRGPGTPGWLRDGETALLVEPCDPEQLAGALERLIDDRQLNDRVRAGARGLSFSWDSLVATVLAVGDRRSPVQSS